MHALLQSQLLRLLSAERLAEPDIAAFVAAVDEAYRRSDSDRARLERSLELSSREATKLRLFLEKLPAITYIGEPGFEGHWSFVSPQIQSLLGYSREEWLADPTLWFQRVHPDDRGAVLDEERRCMAARDQFSLEYRLVARDGHVVWVRDDAVFLPADGDEPDRLHGVMLDVTERRLLEEQLMQAQKVEAIGQLAGGIAHDFNNLLTAITGYAELVLYRLGEEHACAGELREILRAAGRAAGVTGKLLAFSRRQPRDPSSVDLHALLIDLESLLRRLIGERVPLELSLAPGRMTVRAEPTQLEQVVMNLVVNARDAMPQGGPVRIATALRRVEAAGREAVAGLQAGPYVELSVSDSGVGMDAETRRRLFEPFFTTKPAGQGTGLGLAIAYGIVRQAGGAILVESEPGQGATFRVLLPLAEERPGDRPQRPGSLALPGGTERILLVEDDPAVREFAVTLLTALGYRVTTAADGAEALALVERQGVAECDLLLADVVMPRLGGGELARKLRALRGDLPILFASGYPRDDTQVAALVGERCLYLQKPFTPATLAAALRRLLDR